MTDGAHEGITAGAAMRKIVADDPVTEEPMSAEQQAAWILSAQPDLSYAGIVAVVGDEEAYGEFARRLARYALLAMQADPTLARADRDDALWKVVKATAPKDARSCSGFQWGWASNAARRCVEAPPVPNPAIVTVGGSHADR